MRAASVTGALCLLLAACGGGGGEDKLEGTSATSTHGLYEVVVAPKPENSPVNQLHTWTLELRDRDGDTVEGASISVDGDMPEHGHGLPTEPRVEEVGDGRYEVNGMKFQMGGFWYVQFSIAAEPGRDVARVEFTLPEQQ
jgi:hypothetical protein